MWHSSWYVSKYTMLEMVYMVTVGRSKTLFLCYSAVTPIPAQSFQDSTRRRFKKRQVKISIPIAVEKQGKITQVPLFKHPGHELISS